ncbi:hypothetical protein [Nitratireductor sp. GZWM139]|uniref:hypothetical protein n=1 Tax=Nitratireductor sp. GZWM139 TaxID=2950541 RepID=UPI0024BECA7F|nr:hypothetical protein [Nitratireductor sp. GZWM139]MDJ1465638.1 Tn7 transposase TnsA N-terminal domain-containing protein [Nitratireductor sp. GZWM139]
MIAESLLEAKAMTVLLARRNVLEVWEQPEPVWFVDHDGVKRKHTFDLLAQFDDGCRVAYAVKPYSRVRRTGLDLEIELIRQQSLAQIADKAVILTEKQISRARVYNAEQVLRARQMRNEQDCTELRRIVSDITGSVPVHALLKETPDPGLARTAFWCLIDDGVLEAINRDPLHTRICDHTFVRVNHDVLAAQKGDFK